METVPSPAPLSSPPAAALEASRRSLRWCALFLLALLLGCGAWGLAIPALSSSKAISIAVVCLATLALAGLLLVLHARRRLAEAQTEQARLESGYHDYRQRFHSNAGAMLIYDIGSLQILDANPAAEALLGWSAEELSGVSIQRLVPPEREEALGQHMVDVQQQPGKRAHLLIELLLRDGSRRAAELWGNPLTFRGRPARLVNLVDRAEEAATRHQLRTALDRIREAQSIAAIGAVEIDPHNRRIRLSNEAGHLLARRPAPAPLWQPLREALPLGERQADELQQRIAAVAGAGATPLDMLLQVRAMDGRLLTLHLRARAVPADAETATIQGTLQDVSEREQSRQLLREREEQFRELVRVLPDGVVILSDEHVLYINPVGAEQFGSTAEQLTGTNLQSLIASEDLPRVRDYLNLPRRYLDRLPPLVPHIQRQDGSRFLAALSVGELRYGGRDCRLLVIRDLTELESSRVALETGNRELQAMAARLFSVQEDERRAISRDLHDDIGQSITAIKLAAHAAMHETDTAHRNEDIGQIIELVDSTVTRLRNLSMLLRPPQLDALGLEAALSWQAGQLFRASPVELLLEIEALSQRPDNAIEQACFRIAQESLTNSLRHARASQVRLRLAETGEGQLHLTVVDDGEGFDPDGPRGLGLIVMRERAQSVGGRLEIITAPGEGTCIDLHLPLRASPPPETTAGH